MLPCYNPQATQALPAPSSTVVPSVVGPQYCLPYGIDLTITKKVLSFSGGDFSICDGGGNLTFRVDGRALTMRDKRLFLDAAGNCLLCAQRKLWSFHNKWMVFRGSHCHSANELFSVKRSSYFQLRTSLSVFLASNTNKNEPDFRVKGNYLERNCTILYGPQIIAEVKRKFNASSILLGKDTFVVTVFPGIDHAFVSFLIVVMDEIYRDD